jgi:hypothetical protein
MPDFIEIRGIRAFGKHGALPGEREHCSPSISTSSSRSTWRRRARATIWIGHRRLRRGARAHRALVAERSFMLLERLGDAILADLMRDERIGGERDDREAEAARRRDPRRRCARGRTAN